MTNRVGKGLELGKRYAVYCSMIDDVSGNAHTAWVQMGRPQLPDKAQWCRLQEASELKAERLLEVESVGGQCVFCDAFRTQRVSVGNHSCSTRIVGRVGRSFAGEGLLVVNWLQALSRINRNRKATYLPIGR